MKARNFLLGITGGVAVYKAPKLVRCLRDGGAVVQMVMTQSIIGETLVWQQAD